MNIRQVGLGRTCNDVISKLEVIPSVNRILSHDIISNRVQARVKQRDSWEPRHTNPGVTAFSPYWREMLSPSIPSSQELDMIFPVNTPSWDSIRNPPKDKIQCTWIGHSTTLVQMQGTTLLTDPIFSQRCSPSQYFGPKRFRKPACSLREIQNHGINIDIVLLSHNHYDHLDYASMRELANPLDDKAPPIFVVPLGLQSWFQTYISSKIDIVELDWHETITISDSINVTSVPMRHWSNRIGIDRDQTLWCGYVVEGKDTNTISLNTSGIKKTQKFLFPGDTAWFDGLYDIGDQYGPFDLATIPIGAYVPWDFMKAYHLDPPHAILMAQAVRAKKSVPIHFGCFTLTFEPVMEPLEWLKKINSGHNFDSWFIGETITD
jgi:N-acyl-phosphatidylethanolamine-hydrolysing phospholipase D